MDIDEIAASLSRRLHPLVSALLLFCLFILGFWLVGTALGTLAVSPFFGFDLDAVTQFALAPGKHPQTREILLILQGVGSFTGFVMVSWVYIVSFEKLSVKNFVSIDRSTIRMIPLAVLIVFMFTPVNSYISQWNMALDFSLISEGFDDWARAYEDKAAEVTEFMTRFGSWGGFSLSFLVIAVIAGVGEELLFRGLFQNLFLKAWKNPHIAIWLSAFIFSAIHLQFFGFFPRFLLGGLFGYLYYWSGNLAVAIIAHVANNGIILFMLWLAEQGRVEFDLDDPGGISLLTAGIFFIITLVLILVFKWIKQARKPMF